MEPKRAAFSISHFLAAAQVLVLAAVSSSRAADVPATRPSDDSALVGTWQATVATGDIPTGLTWINRKDGYVTTIPGAKQPIVVGSGQLVAQDGNWQTYDFYGPSDQGTYRFMDANHLVTEGSAGIIIVWTRQSLSAETSTGESATPGTESSNSDLSRSSAG